MQAPLQASAVDLAVAIARGDTTSAAVVEAHIAQIERTNGALNAVVHDRFETARAEAAAADARLAEHGPDGLPPLHGVPCTIKESFALTGMPWTAGLVARTGTTASQDAATVARLRAAGAIPLGVTNLSELCMWLESNNRVYGRTNNPYDPSRMVGGSSGGEGASVAAGYAPFGLGADVGGSIRLPAFFNGVFGHKPSSCLVPNIGQFPLGENDALRYLASGPLCRRAADLQPLLRVLAGAHPDDPVARDHELGDADRVDVSKLRVLHIPDNGRTAVTREIRDAQARAADHLGSLGATVTSPSLPRLRKSYDLWSSAMHVAAATPFSVLLGNGEPTPYVSSFLRFVSGRSPHTLPALALAWFEPTADFPRGRAQKWLAPLVELKDELNDLLGDDGVMLYPVFPRTAPKHYQPLLRPFEFVYTAVINAVELPATAIPLGLDRRGLPLGIQAVASWGQDHLSIAIAQELERAFGGWVPPFPTEPS